MIMTVPVTDSAEGTEWKKNAFENCGEYDLQMVPDEFNRRITNGSLLEHISP